MAVEFSNATKAFFISNSKAVIAMHVIRNVPASTFKPLVTQFEARSVKKMEGIIHKVHIYPVYLFQRLLPKIKDYVNSPGCENNRKL